MGTHRRSLGLKYITLELKRRLRPFFPDNPRLDCHIYAYNKHHYTVLAVPRGV